MLHDCKLCPAPNEHDGRDVSYNSVWSCRALYALQPRGAGRKQGSGTSPPSPRPSFAPNHGEQIVSQPRSVASQWQIVCERYHSMSE